MSTRKKPPPKCGPKPRRHWQAGAIGELWQHDSSPHAWWPADHYPVLILTLDDHSRKIVAGSSVRSDTTWDHFTVHPWKLTARPPASMPTHHFPLLFQHLFKF